MATKKEYTVKVAYRVYDYYDIEATSEEQAIKKALEIAGESSLIDFMQDGEGEAIITEINRKSVKPKYKADEMEVLIAYDDSDDSKEAIATMKEADRDGRKGEQLKRFLTDHYSAFLDACDDEGRKEYEEDIADAAARLAIGLPAECCGDDLYFETVKFI